MTISEINALILEDFRDSVKVRLIAQLDLDYSDPENQPEIPEFSDAAYQEEFAEYKAELIAAENERLRQLDLKNRFFAVNDMAFRELHPDKANAAIFIRDLMSVPEAEAESTIAAIEAKDGEIAASLEVAKRNWETNLRNALGSESITESGLLEALIRKEFFGDSSRIDALKDKMIAIDTAHPRPVDA